MSQSIGHTRVCPTRIDGATALFTHKVTVPQCQDRQRGRYHKCFTCSYNNGYVAAHGPIVEKPIRRRGKKASIKGPTRAAMTAADGGDADSPPSEATPAREEAAPVENLIGPLPAPA
ncbi:MAG: hypothetical protein GY711_07515 [bacterium]|nr:hypothetical protein [bacterium]